MNKLARKLEDALIADGRNELIPNTSKTQVQLSPFGFSDYLKIKFKVCLFKFCNYFCIEEYQKKKKVQFYV